MAERLFRWCMKCQRKRLTSGLICDECANSGLHVAGCYFGGPVGESYWFVNVECEEEHEGSEIEPLYGQPSGIRASYQHLQAAGLLRTGEST